MTEKAKFRLLSYLKFNTSLNESKVYNLIFCLFFRIEVIPWPYYGEKMTSESSEYVATQQLRTSSVPQLLNYTLLETSKDLEPNWTQTNQISMWTETNRNITELTLFWVFAWFSWRFEVRKQNFTNFSAKTNPKGQKIAFTPRTIRLTNIGFPTTQLWLPLWNHRMNWKFLQSPLPNPVKKSFKSSQLRFCANADLPKIGVRSVPYGIVNSLCVQSRQIMREKPIITI